MDIRCNAIRFGDLLLLVDIDLGECDAVGAGELRCELIVGGGDGFAWSAPVCVDYRRVLLAVYYSSVGMGVYSSVVLSGGVV